jgi:hypothetical protein
MRPGKDSTRRAALAVAALALALAVASCGGSNSASTGASGASGASGLSGAPAGKDEFIRKADDLCQSGNDTIESASKAFQGEPTGKALERFVHATVVPALQGELDGIEALTPPPGDEAEIHKITSTAQSEIDRLRHDPELYSSGTALEEAARLASAYGLTVCGSD